ncbi:MAG: peptidylprolyl isomerase [bacterium JZ-2024 1]
MRIARPGLVVLVALILAGARIPDVVLDTTLGEIELALAVSEAPRHSRNFFLLSWLGFYDGLTFHRLVPGFVIQGGDPAGNGTGGPGYTVPAEIGLPHDEGVLAAARTGDQVNPRRESSGSQFYITVAPTHRLDGAYSVYGKTVRGMDVVKKIVEQPRDRSDKPLTPIVIKDAKVQSQRVATCEGWKLSNSEKGVLLQKGGDSVTVASEKADSASLFCEPVVSPGVDALIILASRKSGTTLTVYNAGTPPALVVSASVTHVRDPAFWDLDGDGIHEILFLRDHSLTGESVRALGPKLTIPVALCIKKNNLTDCTSEFASLALAYRGLGIKSLIGAGGDPQKALPASAIVWIGGNWLGKPDETVAIVSQFCPACAEKLKPYEKILSETIKSVIQNIR